MLPLKRERVFYQIPHRAQAVRSALRQPPVQIDTIHFVEGAGHATLPGSPPELCSLACHLMSVTLRPPSGQFEGLIGSGATRAAVLGRSALPIDGSVRAAENAGGQGREVVGRVVAHGSDGALGAHVERWRVSSVGSGHSAAALATPTRAAAERRARWALRLAARWAPSRGGSWSCCATWRDARGALRVRGDDDGSALGGDAVEQRHQVGSPWGCRGASLDWGESSSG
jgi:hypothetical protein